MLRPLLTVLALVELLVPRRFISAAERLALENPEECELRAWTIPMARLEAMAFLLLALRGKGASSRLRALLVAIGAPAILFPRSYVEFGASVAYVEPERCRWKPWVVPATRVLGIVYVLAAVRSTSREPVIDDHSE